MGALAPPLPCAELKHCKEMAPEGSLPQHRGPVMSNKRSIIIFEEHLYHPNVGFKAPQSSFGGPSNWFQRPKESFSVCFQVLARGPLGQYSNPASCWHHRSTFSGLWMSLPKGPPETWNRPLLEKILDPPLSTPNRDSYFSTLSQMVIPHKFLIFRSADTTSYITDNPVS